MVQVTINDGVLEGELIEDDLVKFYSFKGIPFATPPVGELRFKAPQPVQPWTGVRPAKSFGPGCYQFNILGNFTHGAEDCLYLNVYTPDLSPQVPLPVMLWIHGGAFMSGSGNDDLYGPELLLRQDVIVVTFNYRVEVLGFLCLDSEEVPGNAGMKDQVAAMKWVRNNISCFGGDPDNVTLFGLSSGSASVTAHIISPMSKGLFKRAIAQSGAVTNAWALPCGSFQSAAALARKLGFYSEDKNELYNFFMRQPPENLIEAKEPLFLYDAGKGFSEIKFAMVLEKDFGQERFLSDDPYETLRVGGHDGIDIIIGYTEDEGVIWPQCRCDLETILTNIEKYDDYLVPRHIVVNSTLEVLSKIGRKFRQYYLGNNFEKGIETYNRMFKFFGMDTFTYGVTQWAKIYSNANKSNVYFYKFTCKSDRNVMTHVVGVRKHLGDKVVASHADDLPYFFNVKATGKKVDKDAKSFYLIDRATKLWSNFAKYGNPTPDDSLGVRWKTYCVEKQEYLEIGNQLTSKFAPDAEEMEFWENIYKEFYPKCVFHETGHKQ